MKSPDLNLLPIAFALYDELSVSRAARLLAGSRHGALIVLERETGLADLATGRTGKRDETLGAQFPQPVAIDLGARASAIALRQDERLGEADMPKIVSTPCSPR